MTDRGFTVPAEAAGLDEDQSEVDKVDFDILAAGSRQTGVTSGGGVTAAGGSMDVVVAASAGMVEGVPFTNAGDTLTIAAADGLLSRYDLIVVEQDGTLSVWSGSPAAKHPRFPDDTLPTPFPAVLAAVRVGANVSEVVQANVVPKRVLIAGGGGFAIGSSVLWAGAALTGQASGTYPQSGGFGGFAWVEGFLGAIALPASAGSDLAINGGDASLIDVLTDGLYQGLLQVAFQPETAPDTLTFYEAGWGPDFFNSAIWPTQFGAGTTEATDPGATACVPLPAIFIPAGSQIKHFIGSYVSNPSNTWHATGFFQIMRVA